MQAILLVEDDLSLARESADALCAPGFEVIAVAGSLAGLHVLESTRRIDLMVTDIQMPADHPQGVALGSMAQLRRSRCRSFT